MNDVTCRQCHKPIAKRSDESRAKHAARKFCGIACNTEAQRAVRKHFNLRSGSPTSEQMAQFFAR